MSQTRRGRPPHSAGSKIHDLRTHPIPHVTVTRLAEYWGYSRWTVGAYVRRGLLRAIRLGKDYRIRTVDAIAFEKSPQGPWAQR